MDKYITDIPFAQYEAYARREAVRPRFRLLRLNSDESVRDEIREDLMLDGGSYSEEYTDGSRRTLTLSVFDGEGKYSREGLTSSFWWGKRFRFDAGIEVGGIVYWSPLGVFTPTGVEGEGEEIITVSFADKFALLDGTVGGRLETDYKIQRGENIFRVIQSTLLSDCGSGYAFDPKEPYMDEDLKELKTYYTMTRSAESSYGDMLGELAEQLCAEYYYDGRGNLNIRTAVDDLSLTRTPSLWTFSSSDRTLLEISENVSYTDKYNVIRVVGAQIDGDLLTCQVENTNPLSPLRVGLSPRQVKVITDSNIVSQKYVNDRALLELFSVTLNEIDFSLRCSFLPHLRVGSCVIVNSDRRALSGERLFVKGISFSLSSPEMTLNCVNIKDMPYFENYGYDLIT